MIKNQISETIAPKSAPFTESQMATKYGTFMLRVYPDETVVLWKDLSNTQPILVRVHSECLTGDLFGSYKCDCGKQFEQSLKAIDKNGGVFIYLRQEGRGIGLFEKIKAYQIQQEGYDTFEANVMLGHPPDQRTYEMAAKALFDLSIDKIELMTNNPSKVTALALLGINVVKQRSLPIKACKHNKKYLETKQLKFQHQYHNPLKCYSYQFHLESPSDVPKVKKMLNKRIWDPLLIIAVGINVNAHELWDKKTREDLKKLYAACKKEGFTPVVHLSFKGCKDQSYIPILKELKTRCPYVESIHLNDMDLMKPIHVQIATELFSVAIPLCNTTFYLVEDVDFRELVKTHDITLYLDKSKGRGIKESKSSFMKKIDHLLEYGLNTIGLCGGFGPECLSTFFFLKKHYKINFSIDAETKLKTNKRIDLEKIDDYLAELTHTPRKPKTDKIIQTKKMLEASKTQKKKIILKENIFYIHSNVFHPGIFPSTAWFASELLKQLQAPYDFCEVGCGAGVISCLLALSHPKVNVSATDINADACENTKVNATNLGVRNQLSVYNGNVLDALDEKMQFDYIFWALPFGYLDPVEEINLREAQVFDPGYRATEKFLKSAKKHLKKNGKLLLGFSQDLGHPHLLEELASQAGVRLKAIASSQLKEVDTLTFQVLEGQYQ